MGVANLKEEESGESGRPLVVVVEDESGIRGALCDFLGRHGYVTREADSGAAVEAMFAEAAPDAVLLDDQLADGNSLVLLPQLRRSWPGSAILLMTGQGSIDLAVKAIQQGADQFLTKPVDLPALLTLLERTLESHRATRKQKARALRSRPEPNPFLGRSPAIRALAEEARGALESASPVLITGETGSGKGLLAHWLHRNGQRANEPFVDLCCVGLSREQLESELFGHETEALTSPNGAKEGLLEVARRGTVFLDELGDMDLAVQAKLLKVIEERRFRRLGGARDRRADVRVIAATHHDLEGLVREKKFRADLYDRLSVLVLHVPPLRERPGDIEAIAKRLLEVLLAEMGRPPGKLAPDAVETLAGRSWPGNVRELRNVIERAVLRSHGPELRAADLPPETDDPAAAPAAADTFPASWDQYTLEQLERIHIGRVLRQENGQVERAAVRLGIGRSTLYHKLKTYGI